MRILRLAKGDLPIVACGFDVDGTLRDTGVLAFNNCCAAIVELGGTPPTFAEFVHDWGGKLNRYYRSRGVKQPDEEIRQVNAKYLPMNNLAEPYADVEPALKYFESLGLGMFALSGHGTADVEEWCTKHNLRVRFDHVRGDGSDKTRHLVDLCRQLSVDPSQACYVGDWAQDMRAAREAGMVPVGVARSQQTHEILVRNGALLVVDHLSELAERIS